MGGGTTVLSGASGEFAPNSTTASNTASSASTSLVLTSATGLVAGEAIEGPGIAPGTTISSISTNTLTLSQPATVGANATLSYGGSNSIVVDPSATLTLNNATATTGGVSRLGNHTLTLNGGALNFIGNGAGTTEGTLGVAGGLLALGSGQSVITTTNNGGNTILNFGALTQAAGSTLDIEGTSLSSTNQINVGVTNLTAAAATSTVTLTLSNTAGLFLGEPVSGLGILNGTTISTTAGSITATTVTLNLAPNAIVNGVAGVANGEQLYFGLPMAGATSGITALTNAILPRITIGGAAWATEGATGLTAFTNYSTPGDVTATGLIASPAAVLQVNSSTTNALFSAGTAPGGRIFNALAINNSGITSSPASPYVVGVANDAGTGLPSDLSLTLGTGGILVTGSGTDTLNATRIVLASLNVGSTAAPSATGSEGIIQVAPGATLNLGGAFVGTLITNTNAAGTIVQNFASPVSSVATGGITKGLGGTLSINAQQFYTGGTTTLNGGTTVLNAGNNTLFENGSALTVNYGATLDLNGTTEVVGVFSSGSGIVPGAGGVVTSNNGAAMLVANGGATTWAGSITGSSANAVSFARVGGGTALTVESANPYFGATFVYGSTVTLQDNGSIQNTSAITLNNSVLNLQNEADLFINNNNRVNAAAPVTMNASEIQLIGLADAYSLGSFGALSTQSGANILTDTVNATGVYGNADLIFASINHSADATVNFTSGNTLGAEGANPRILFTNASGLNYSAATGMIGAWAIANSDTWAAYNPSLGVGAVGTSGYQSYTGGYMAGGTATVASSVNGTSAFTTYSGGTLVGFAAGDVTNIQAGTFGQNQLIVLPAGGANTDYLRFAGLPENDLGFTNPTDVLNLNQGGLMHSNSTTIPSSTMIGSTAIRGVLTTGGTLTTGTTELVVFDTAFATTTTAFTGTATNALVSGSNVLTLTSTTNLFPGMGVTGTGIPAGTAVVSVLSPTQVILSQNATAAANAGTYTLSENATGALATATVLGSNVLTLAATDNVYAGMAITGTGIPTGAYITSVLSPTQVTINYNATAAGTDQAFTLSTNTVINSSIADNGLGNLTRLNKSGTGTLTLTSGATALNYGASLLTGQNFITVPAGFTSFNGETVSGPGIPNGTTIVSGGGTTQLFLSNNATSTGASNLTFGTAGASTASGAVGNTTTVTGLSSTAGLYIGEPVFGTNIPVGALVASVINGTSITLTSAATGGASPAVTSLTFGVSSGNSYSGGTVVNEGTLNLAGGAPGTLTIPAGNLTIIGAQTGISATVVNVGVTDVGGNIVGIGGQFDPSTIINVVGKSTLNLSGINSINSLTFNNNGTDGAPTVNVAATTTVPAGVLNLTSSTPITATSNNPANFVSTIATGTLNLAVGADTMNIGPVQINNLTVTQLVPTLNITSAITGIAGTSITKTGLGLLELTNTTSTFDSGVNLTAGGIEIGNSSTPTTAHSAVTGGPLGLGTFTIASGTYLTSSASANTVANNLSLGGRDLTLLGSFGLTLNGAVTLNPGNTTVNVEVPGVTLALGGVITDTNGTSGLIKTGLGTLALNNNNGFGGSVTIDAGVLVLGGVAGSVAAPLANPNITITSNGTLALQNNGLGNNGLITYSGLNITVGGTSNYANLYVADSSANTGNTIEVPQLTLSSTIDQVLNLANSNNYSLILQSVSDPAGLQLNIPSGMTVTVYNYTAGEKPVNIGAGTLVLPDAVTIGTSTALNGGSAIELSTYNGSNYYPLVINAQTPAPTTLPTGPGSATIFQKGGLNAVFSSLGSTEPVISTPVAGIGFSGSGLVATRLNDGNFNNRALATTASFVNSVASLTGLLDINTAGTYVFRSGADDGGTLYIDGVAVLSDNGGHAITQATGNGSIFLTAGFHVIDYKPYNEASAGSYQLLYAGADTANNGVPNTTGTGGVPSTDGFQAISSNNLYYVASTTPTYANGYNYAAIDTTPYTLAASQTATIDTLGSQFGAVVNPTSTTAAALTLNSGTAALPTILSIVNGSTGTFGAGFMGFDGNGNGDTGGIVIGSNVIINTGSNASMGAGALNLIGNIADSNVLVKTGSGTLILGGNNNATFTGSLTVQNGFVQVNSANALPAGGTTINSSGPGAIGNLANSSATVALTAATGGIVVGDLVFGPGIPAGTTVTAASATSLTLSATLGTAAALTGAYLTFAAPVSSTTVLGSSVITVATTGLSVGEEVAGTGIPLGAFITSIGSGNVTISAPATAAGAVSLAYFTGASIDLNGTLGVAGNITVNGIGSVLDATGAGAATATGALWNSSVNPASLAGTLTIGANGAFIGGNGNLTLNTISPASGIPTLFKTGTDTLTLNAANGTSTFNTNILQGTLQLANATALGATANTVTIANGAVLDLNGQTVANANPVTITGVGYGGSGAVTGVATSAPATDASSLGALINTSASAASYAGTITLAAATSIGSNYVNGVSGVTQGGTITLSGQVTGGFGLTKVGANTLNLTGTIAADTVSGYTVALGTLEISGGATSQLDGAGAVTVNAGPQTAITGVATAPFGFTSVNVLDLDYQGLTTSLSRADGHTVTFNGGELLLNANYAYSPNLAENEGNAAVNLAFSGAFNLIKLQPSTTSSVEYSTTGAGTLSRSNKATVLVEGNNLGTAAVGTAGDTNVVFGTFATSLFVGQTIQTANATNAGIVPWLVVDNSATGVAGAYSFATYSTANAFGLQALSAGDYSASTVAWSTSGVNGVSAILNNNFLINTTSGAQTLVASPTGLVAGSGVGLAVYSPNSLTFGAMASGTALTINGVNTVGVQSGGILDFSGSNLTIAGSGFLNGGLSLTSNAIEMVFQIFNAGGSSFSPTTLQVNTNVGGALAPTTGGLTKSGDGTLVLNNASVEGYTGQTTVNLGTLQIGATGASLAPANNPLYYPFTTPSAISSSANTSAVGGSVLQVNAGGALNLNGSAQTVGQFNGAGALPGSAGIVTSTATGSPVDFYVMPSTATNFAGQINGNLNFIKSGAVTLSLNSSNSYTGATLVLGNVLSLVDQGTLSNTSGVTIVDSALQWNDTGIEGLTNRLPSNVPLTLDGGAFQLVSRSGLNESISLGTLTLNAGASVVREDVGQSAGAGAGIGSASINFTSLASRNIGATLNFYSGTGEIGDNPFITFTTAPTLTNGIIGGWAVVLGQEDSVVLGANIEFATYDPVAGVAPLTAAMQYSSFSLANGINAANVRLGASAGVLAGGQTVNSLTLNNAAVTVSFINPTDALTVASGGILSGNDSNARTIGSITYRGALTTATSAGNPNDELFINQGNNTLTVNSQIEGTGLNLVLNGMGLANGQVVVLTANNTYTGNTYSSGVIAELDNTTGSGYALGTGANVYLTGSNSAAGDSLPIADSAIRLFASSQINPAATLTIRGESELDLGGYNQTLGSLVLNSVGGSNGGNGSTVLTGAGALTLTATTGTIAVSNLQDLRTIPSIFGNLVLPSAAEITVAANADGSMTNNGFVNQQIGLALNSGLFTSTSTAASAGVNTTLTVDGAGALSLGGASNAALTLNVSHGEVVLAAGSNYQNTSIALSSGAAVDLRGQTNLQVGAITGSGVIKNFSATATTAGAATLVVGSLNTNFEFDGTLVSDYSSGLLNVTKIGSGVWTLTGADASQLLGTLLVEGGASVGAGGTASGGIYLGGANATLGFTNYTLASGGNLVLDDTTNAVSGRLGINGIASGATAGIGNAYSGQARVLQMQGGTLAILGGATAVTETVNEITMTNGGGGVITLAAAGTGGVNLTVLGSTSIPAQNGSGTLLILGDSLGGAAGANVASIKLTTAPAYPAAGGLTGSANTAAANNDSVRPDIIGDTSASGVGADSTTGFITDIGGVLTPLNQGANLAGSSSGNSVAATSLSATINVGLGAGTSAAETGLATNVSTYTLTLLSGGGGFTNLFGTSGGNYGAAGLLTVTVADGGLLGLGGALGSNVALTSGAVTFDIHVTGNNSLTLNDSILNTTNGIVKADGGTLVFNAPQYYSGVAGSNGTVINGGEIQLGASAGNNAILVNPTATIPTVLDLRMNGVGSIFDLNGNSQAVGQLSSVNPLAGEAGNIITSTGAPTLTTVSGTSGTALTTIYAGSIGGSGSDLAISLNKQGLNILELTAANSYTGSTSVIGGTLLLRDAGALTGTTSIAVDYATLTLDNTGLAINNGRVPSGAPITLLGATLNYLESQGTPALGYNTPSIGSVAASTGASVINQTGFLNASTALFGGSASSLTMAGLSQSNSATLSFTATGGGTIGAPIAPTGGFIATNSGINAQVIITGSATSLAAGLAGGNNGNLTGTVTGGVTLANGIIGPWAVVTGANGVDWATYSSAANGGFQGVGPLGATYTSLNALTTSGSVTINVASTAGLVAGTLVTGTNIPANDTIASINNVADTITLALPATASATTTLTLYPFGAYSANGNGDTLATAGTGNAADNIQVTASTGAVTSRVINTLKTNSTTAITITENGLDQTINISGGGILTQDTLGTNFQSGRYTAGTASGASLYVFANLGTDSLQAQVVDTLGGGLNLVKSGSAQVNLGVSPIVNVTGNNTTTNTVTTTSTNGLVVGEVLPVTVSGVPAGAVITGITSATTFTVNVNASGTANTAANSAIGFATSQVLTNPSGGIVSGKAANTPFTLQLPVGSVVLPGMVVSQAVGTGGVAGLFGTGTVTVLSYNATTGVATVVDSTATAATSTAATTLVVAPAAAQTVAVTNTSGTTTLTLGATANAGVNVGQLVTGTGIAGGTYVTAVSGTGPGSTITLSVPTTAAVTSAVVAATAASSQLATTSTASSTVTLLTGIGTSGVFVGESVSGVGIAPGTTVSSVMNANQITLSATPTANPSGAAGSGTGNIYFGIAPVGVNIAGLSVPSAASTLTLTAAQAAGLAAGMSVTGFGISPGTTISSISGTTVTLNQATAAVGAGATATLTFGAPLNSSANNVAATGTTGNSSVAVTVGSTAGLYPGMSVSGVNIPSGDTIASVSGTTITLATATNATGAGAGTLTFFSPATIVAFSEGYTGNTVVDQGTLAFGGTALGAITIPGNLIINGGNTTTATTASQSTAGSIANTSNVIINGTGALTLLAGSSNTLASINFNSTGGSVAPIVSGGTLVITGLNSTNGFGISSVNNDLAFTPSITSILELAGVNLTINTSGTSPNDLNISSVIQNAMGGAGSPAGLVKSGTGSLALSGANTFNGGVQLNGGSLIIAANSTGSPVTSGPLGTGTLTISGNSTILAGAAAQTVANSVVVNSDFTFGGLLSTNNLTLSGSVQLGSASRNIFVTSPAVTATLSGAVTSTATGTAFTKAGAGALLLSGAANSFGGATVAVSGGVLEAGSVTAIESVAATGPAASGIQVSAGAVFDTHGQATLSIGSLSGGTLTTGGLVTNDSTATSTTLTIGNDNASQTFAGSIVDTSAGVSTAKNLALIKAGTGTQSLSGVNTYSGATAVNNGALNLVGLTGASSQNVLGATVVTVAAGKTLSVTNNVGIGTLTAGALTLSGAGSTLSLQDGTINTLTFNNNTAAATNLTLGAGASLLFDIQNNGASSTDEILVTQMLADNATAPTVGLNTLGANTLAVGTYTLMSYATSTGLTPFTFSGGATTEQLGGGVTYALNTTGTQLQLVVTAIASPTPVYWTGLQNSVWSTINSGNATNWSTSVTGTPDSNQIPGSNSDVYFTANNATGNFTTTLGQNFAINSLTFLGTGPAAANAITIGGANTLTLNAAAEAYSAGTGIVVNSGNAGVTLSTNVALGVSQTWTNNSTNALNVSGAISQVSAGSSLTLATTAGAGAGAFSFSGNESYTGGTNVAGGAALTVTSTGSLSSGSALTLDSNAASTATFANVGQTLGAVTNGDTTANSLNFSAVSGTVTLASLTGAGSTNFASNASITGQFDTGTAAVAGAASIGTVASGTLTVGGIATIATVSGGTQNLRGSTSSITTLNGAGTVNLQNTVLTVNKGAFSGSIADGGHGGGLTKGGAATDVLTLSGSNNYVGVTSVNAGTVIVSGSISGTSSVSVGGGAIAAALTVNGTLGTSGALALSTNGTLSGNGIVTAASLTANSGGTVAPSAGDSAGLTVNNGPVTLSAGSTLQLSIANSNAGTLGAPALADYSKLTLGSGVSANIGGSTIAVSISSGTVNTGDLFTVILNGGSAVTGKFANANTNQVGPTTYAFTSNGQSYQVNYAFNGSTTGSGITQTAFDTNTGGKNVAVLMLAVPEPNSWSMLLGSLGIALGLQRFRRRRS